MTTRLTRVEGEVFKTDGRVIKDPGWLAVYGREAANPESGEATLVAIDQGEDALAREIEVRQSETKPPARYNEATLLATMEGAGKLIEDEELRAALSAKGLGTPATRAAIIEGLILDEYIARHGRELSATSKGVSLINLLKGIGVAALCSPEMTGGMGVQAQADGTGRLAAQGIHGANSRADRGYRQQKRRISRATPWMATSANWTCVAPKCGARPLKEEYRVFRCASCDYVFWKSLAGRTFDPEEIKTLLTEGRIGPLDGFRSKEGRPFSAAIKLGPEGKAEFDFPPQKVETIDLEVATALCGCAVCKKGQVYATEASYGLQPGG